MDTEHPLVTARRMTGGRKPDYYLLSDGAKVPVHSFTAQEEAEVLAQELRFAASRAGVPVEALAAGYVLGVAAGWRRMQGTLKRDTSPVGVVIPVEAKDAVLAAISAAGLNGLVVTPPDGARATEVHVG